LPKRTGVVGGCEIGRVVNVVPECEGLPIGLVVEVAGGGADGCQWVEDPPWWLVGPAGGLEGAPVAGWSPVDGLIDRVPQPVSMAIAAARTTDRRIRLRIVLSFAGWLEGHLEELYGEVRTGRFSTIIACRFDRDSRQVTSSERVTPLYRADGRA
jgi:hypothetical protein